MGSRLGVIVLDESGPELYYDHWAANTIGMDIAIDGVEPTLARVRGMEPMGVDTPAEWQGAAWIEGSLLIDLTRRRVVWAEESDYLYLPRIVNHLIERTWPGWTALWSPEGVRGILWLAGVDPATIFTENGPWQPTIVQDPSWFAPWSDRYVDGAISVRLDDQRLVAWRGGTTVDVVAELGPDLIGSVAEETLTRGAAGEPVLWDSQPRDELPDSGIHVDFHTMTLRWWSLGDNDMQIDAFDALWPGWSVQTMGDAYELHESIVGKRMRDWAQEVAVARSTVQRAVSAGPRKNPILTNAAIMADLGEEIEINAPALKFNAASDFGGAEAAVAALDVLGVEPPLPPARIVNRRGEILVPTSLPGLHAGPNAPDG